MQTKVYKYQQLIDHLLGEIASGRLKQNDRIPAEKELARTWGMSPMTVGRALAELEREGYLIRRVGDGTYVQSTAPAGRQTQAPVQADQERYVAMLINDLSYGLIPHLTHQIEEQLTRLGYHVLLKSLQHSMDDALQILKTLDNTNICGFIFNPIYSVPYEYENQEICLAMERFGKPIIIIDNYLKRHACNFVTTDNFQGAYEATRHLIEHGHRRIAIMWGDRNTSTLDRLDGYARAQEEQSIFYRDEYVIHCEYRSNMAEGGNPCAEKLDALLALPNPPTAIFALDDYLAHYTMQYCRTKEIAVPDQLALVGFDDFLPSEITTVRQDEQAIARHAVQLFTDLIEGKTPSKTQIFVPPRLIVRSTT